MKMFEFKALSARTVVAGCAIGLFVAAQSAAACTLGNWSATSGAVDPGSPNPDPANGEVLSKRYSGLCAMAASGSGYVQDNSPGGIDRIRARFYVLADNSTDAIVYEGFSGSNSVFTVELEAAGRVVLSGNGIGDVVDANGVSGDWNSIELDWDSGTGQVSLWVNSDARAAAADDSGSLTPGQTVTSVRLGNIGGAAGDLVFDAYESRRTTEIGQLCPGDADPSGTSAGVRDFADISVIFDEFTSLGTNPASGTPDANNDGEIDFADISIVFDLFTSLQGDCPNA